MEDISPYVIFHASVSIQTIMEEGIEIILNVSFMCIGFVSVALWFNVYKKKKILKTIVIQFHRIALLSSRNLRSTNFVINIYFIILIVILILSANGHVTSLPQIASNNGEILTFLLVIENQNLKHIVRIISCSLLLINLAFISVFFAILCSSVYFKCSELLGIFCENIAYMQFREPLRLEVVNLLQKYRLLHRMTHDVEKGLSSVSFLILCSQMQKKEIALARSVDLGGKEVSASVIWITIPSVTVIPVSVIILTLSASRIGSKVQVVQFTLQSIYDSWICRDKVDRQSLEMVKNMMETYFPTMSAYGIVELKRGLVLSVFGSLFTYGLLVVNIK